MNANNAMGEVLLNLQDELQFFAPELLITELGRYSDKLRKASKLSEEQIAEASIRVLGRIVFISEELISAPSWKSAFELVKDVDEDDTPFVALSLELGAKLWTGDKKLTIGLLNKGSDIAIATPQIAEYLKG